MEYSELSDRLAQINIEDYPDLAAVFIAPQKKDDYIPFLNRCWDDTEVSPNNFVRALNDRHFEKYFDKESIVLELFILTENTLKEFENGNTVQITLDHYFADK